MSGWRPLTQPQKTMKRPLIVGSAQLLLGLLPAAISAALGGRPPACVLRSVAALMLACVVPALSAQTVSALTSVTRTSPATVSAGANVTYTLGITHGAERIVYASVVVADAGGTQRTLNTLSVTSEATVSVPASATWLNGSYTIRYAAMIDTADRVWLYYPDGRLSLSSPLAGVPATHSLNLSNQGFQLTGGSNTVALSSLTSVTRTSAATITSGERVAYTLGIAHGPDRIDFASVVLVDAAGTERTLSTLSVTAEARVSITSSASWPNGSYAIKYVGIIDTTNRVWLYY